MLYVLGIILESILCIGCGFILLYGIAFLAMYAIYMSMDKYEKYRGE